MTMTQAPAQDVAPQPQPASPAAAPPAAAPPAAKAPAAPIEGTPAVVVDGQQLESILGRKVRADNGDDMGRIVDLLADKTGQMRAAIIDFGGFLGVGSRQIAVDWKAVRFATDGKAADSVIVSLTRDQLRVAPAYKPGEQVVVLGPNAPSAPRAASAAPPAPPVETPAEPLPLGAPKERAANDQPPKDQPPKDQPPK